MKLAGEGPAPVLALTYGQLPDGISLGADGYLQGSPKTPGQYQHFTVLATTPQGEQLDTRSYQLAVGVTGSSLSSPTMPARHDDVLSFDGITWNSTVSFAFGWDSQLNMLWPLRAGGSLSGQTMAPAGSTLSLIVAGSDAQGQFDLAVTPMDSRIASVAALTWDGDADFDLVLVPEPSLNANIVTEQTPTFTVGGSWVLHHEISSSTAPGPEVVSFASAAPAGRYALVALKKAGSEVHAHLWLSAHRRDGSAIIEQDFDSLFSDVATGTLTDEMSSGRQSYRSLGIITLDLGGNSTFSKPTDGPDLFGSAQADP